MVEQETKTDTVIDQIEKVSSDLLAIISSIDEAKINLVPFANSWTPAQVAIHVTKSNKGLIKYFELQGELVSRKPDAGVETLRKIFLDFETKLEAPEFIVPKPGTYIKSEIVSNLQKSFGELIEVARNTNLLEEVSHEIFQNVTKLEMSHFVVYHTMRHIHQLQNILKALA